MNNFGKFKNTQVAQLIDHGPRTFQEYLLIFPDACPSCGSRDWVEIAWTINDGEQNQFREVLIYSKCVYCEQIKGNFSRIDERIAGWYTESSKKYYRVSSPYLSQIQNNTIDDWNWTNLFEK